MEPNARWKLMAEVFRLWLPVVLSLCAISLTVYQARAMRVHQRLSVRPRLDWNIDVDRRGAITYALVNTGIGPAELKAITLTVDGKDVGPDGPETCARIDAALGRGAPAWDTGCFDMVDDFVIRAGDSVRIYTSSPAADAAVEPRTVTPEEYLRVGATGTYCSFYEDCWPLK